MFILTLLTVVFTILVAIASAFVFVTYRLEKTNSRHSTSANTNSNQDNNNNTQRTTTQQTVKKSATDLFVYCDSDNSDDDSASDGEPDEDRNVPEKANLQMFAYLNRKSGPHIGVPSSSSLSTDPLASSKRRVVVSKEVDIAIERLLEELIDLYIFSWYKPLVQLSMSDNHRSGSHLTNNNANNHTQTQSKNEQIALESVDQLRVVLKNDIWLLLSSFIDRLYSANYVHFVATSLVNRVIKHVQFVKKSKLSNTASGTSISLSSESTTNLFNIRDHSINSMGKRTFSTESSSLTNSLSSTSSTSSLSSSVSTHHHQPNLIVQPEAKSQSTSSSTSDSPILFPLVSHLLSPSAEHNLLHNLSHYLITILLKESLEEKSILAKSNLFKLLLSEFLASSLSALINRLSNPSFVNYQMVRFIKRQVNIKDMIHTDSIDHSGGLLSSHFSVYDLKLCLTEHNFNRLMEILDQCDDIDSLKTIRMHIIGEILDAAVVDFLNKQQDGGGGGGGQSWDRGSTSVSVKSLSPFSSRKRLHVPDNMTSHSTGSGTRTIQRSSLFQQLRLTGLPGVLGTIKDDDDSPTKELQQKESTELLNSALRRHFNFNANINSKVKVLQAKDIRRLINKLRYAKTICEQKIQMHKRNSASLLVSNTSKATRDAELSVNSLEDSKYSFDISFNSELVKSFRKSSVESDFSATLSQSPSPCDVPDCGSPMSDRLFANLKPKQKKIFKFNVIMANDFSRAYFKRYLQQSLFNQDTRSSRNKFRKDVLICECCAYLVDVWETIQVVCELFCAFFTSNDLSSPIQHHRLNSRQIADLNSLFSHSYLLVLQTIGDSRFYYTFSDQFLQLPNELMKSLEAFLLGDVELAMLRRSFDDISIERLAQRLDFTDVAQLTASTCLMSRIDLPAYLNVFITLERIIFKCLSDEFYPQFLISAEYDEMLFNCNTSHTVIDVEKVPASARWAGLKFSNFEAPDQVLNRQFGQLSQHSKPINKVLLCGDPIDIVKNRAILLNCLEFPLLCLQSVQYIVLYRLSLKMYIKDVISQSVTGLNPADQIPLFADIGQVVNRDIVYYQGVYSHLYSMISSVYCWLHSDFHCSVTDVQVEPISKLSSASYQQPESSFLSSWVENIFSSESSTSNQSGIPSTSGDSNYRLTFRVNTTTFPSGLDHLPSSIRTELQCAYTPFWSTGHSLVGLTDLFTKWLSPNLRMMTYLCRYSLQDFVHVLSSMAEPKHAILMLPAELPNSSTVDSNSQAQIAYWEKLIKHLSQDQLAIKRLFRHEVRDRTKRDKQQQQTSASSKYDKKLSFKKLLDKESANARSLLDHSPVIGESSSRTSSVSSSTSMGASATSADLLQIEHIMTHFFSRLTIDRNIVKTNGFLNLIQYEMSPPNMNTHTEHASHQRTVDLSSLCLRCQLSEHLIENNNDDLNSLIVQSLCLVSYRSGLDPRSLISGSALTQSPSTSESEGSSANKPNSRTKLMDALQLPQQATKLFLQSNSALPRISGLNQSGQLLFLHARSLLHDRSPQEMLDFSLSTFRNFEQFCPTCTRSLSIFKLSSEGRVSNVTTRKRVPIKFRLFNIDPNNQAPTSRRHRRVASSGSQQDMGFDVAASLKDDSTSDLSSLTSSMLNENMHGLLDEDGLGSMGEMPFSIGLGSEDFESNLIEPLFQLLIEVFELKGTMIRTLRRTLMFGFRLVFGSTMFSKQIKMSLQQLFTDSNILHLISLMHSIVKNWNTELNSQNGDSNVDGVGAKPTSSQNPNNQASRASSINAEPATPTYLSDLTELLESFPSELIDGLTEQQSSTTKSTPSGTRPGSSLSNHDQPDSTEQGRSTESSDNNNQSNEQQASNQSLEEANIARLQILAKQLIFASVPTFLNHLFGAENTITGLNKSFDILQYQKLNKQLFYECIEAFLLEYYPEFKKI